jgi:hypothetical protein
MQHHTLGGDGKVTSRTKKQALVPGAVGKLTRYLSVAAPGVSERMMTRSIRSELER